MAATWNLSPKAVASTVTLTQMGYALGLLLIVPLGDRVERRRLICTMLCLASVALVAVGLSPSPAWLLSASLLMGVLNITPQLLLPLAAGLAPPGEGGRVVGTVVSGIIGGVLIARTASGTLGQFYGWRVVYFAAAAVNLLLAVMLRSELPEMVAGNPGMRYPALLRSLVSLLRDHPALRLSSFLSAMSFGAFSAFWTVVPFLLKGEPYRYGTATIGLFGLIGATGTLIAPLSGRLADRGHSSRAIAGGLLAMLAAFTTLWIAPYTLVLFVIAMIAMDGGTIANQTANQHRVYGLAPEARNRLNTVYMVMFFLGGSLGSFAGSWGWTLWGWGGCCAVACTFILAALIVFTYCDRLVKP